MAPDAASHGAWEEPSAPGSLKAPDIHSSKLDALAQQRKDSENVP